MKSDVQEVLEIIEKEAKEEDKDPATKVKMNIILLNFMHFIVHAQFLFNFIIAVLRNNYRVLMLTSYII